MSEEKIFVASPEAKSKATKFRIIAVVAWVTAMAGQVYAIFNLISDEKLMWLIGAMVVMLALAITGSYFWKKANRLDPASEKEPTRFFIQNQLGAIMGVLAFLPLAVMILMNKEIDGKTKGIAGTIAVVAMAAAGITGADFDPPSVEKYTKEIQEQTAELESLNVTDDVYWSSAGNKYHIDKECHHIADRSVSRGTVKESFESKGISELCKTCRKRAAKRKLEVPSVEGVLTE